MSLEQVLKINSTIPDEKRLVLNLMMVSNQLNEQISEVLKPHDISGQQYNVLRILKGQNGKPANLSTINDRMIYKMSNTTRLVDKLVLKNLCKRVVCPSNRRKVEITITKDGLETLKNLDVKIDHAEKEFCNNLNKEELILLNKFLDELRS